MTKLTIRRRPLALLGLCAATAGAKPAAAAVRYELVDQTYEFPLPPDPAITAPPFSLALTVSGAAVARGSFSARVDADAKPQIILGDAADFVRLIVPDGAYAPGGPISRGFADVQLLFDRAGDVASSAIRYYGDVGGANLRGTGSAISGFYVREGGWHRGTGSGRQCSVFGILARVVGNDPSRRWAAQRMGG